MSAALDALDAKGSHNRPYDNFFDASVSIHPCGTRLFDEALTTIFLSSVDSRPKPSTVIRAGSPKRAF